MSKVLRYKLFHYNNYLEFWGLVFKDSQFKIHKKFDIFVPQKFPAS